MKWMSPANGVPGFVVRWAHLLSPPVWEAAKDVLVRYRLMRPTNERKNARASFNRKLREWMFTADAVVRPESEKRMGSVFYYQTHYSFQQGCEWWRLPLGRMELRRELEQARSDESSATRRALKAQI